MEDIEERVKKLPPEMRREVEDFIDFLAERKASKRGRKLRQDWAGAIEGYKDQFTSLGLQKIAIEWRSR